MAMALVCGGAVPGPLSTGARSAPALYLASHFLLYLAGRRLRAPPRPAGPSSPAHSLAAGVSSGAGRRAP